MELPKQFKKYEHLIKIIRKLIFPNYLKTKEECLRWWVNYIHDGMHDRTIPLSDKNIVEYASSDKSYVKDSCYYDIKLCSSFRIDDFDVITQTKISEIGIFQCLEDVKIVEFILKETLRPSNSNFRKFIEASVGKEVYPLDKNVIFEMLSMKEIRGLEDMFLHRHFKIYKICQSDKFITIRNNNCLLRISKEAFETYCHFNDIIQMCQGEKINIIDVPFTFSDKAGYYFNKYIVNGGFLFSFDNTDEDDYEGFKSLILYFQVTFS